MMKRTSLTFLAAVGLYLAALVLPREAPEETVLLPLDLVGIDEVEVVSPVNVGIIFTRSASPQLQYPVGKGHRVTVTREGRRLRIVSNVEGYQGLGLRLAPGLRKLVVPGAEIDAEVRLDSLAIESSGGLLWSGDAARLRVVDTSRALSEEESRACAQYCDDALKIQEGRIGDLSVSTRRSSVLLTEVDTIDRTTLTLGKGATFSIEQASRMPDITLLPYPAQAQAPEATKP